uniref:SFI1 centrin binding protein n=1 Tax=Balaenoptera musculus TaxID=9771 RepID=A0A8C0D5C5_BALMU
HEKKFGQRILQKVFEEWREEWWVSHREWKLRVRADCHYRYYLYNLMFQTWKTYMHQQREMRNRYLRAEDHDAKQKMRQAWKSWLIYVVFRRTKLRMQTTALEFRQRSILWVWWSTWRRQLGQVRLGRALHASAVKHRAWSLQLQAWSRWQEQLLHVWREKRKMVSAVKHHQHWQQWRALRAWLEYLQVRREKRQRKEMAEGFHCIIVLQTHFCDWRWAWKRRESLYVHHERVEGLARRMVLRRAFIHWKHCILCTTQHATDLCPFFFSQHFCFRALKDNVARAHLQRIRRNLAHQQHDVMLLHRFWNLWQSQIDQREESEQLPFLCAAWDHYRITLLRKCFKLWLLYTQKRRSQQLLQARADSHFQRRALPGAFQAWRRLWQWHQQERVLYARAARFHRVMLEKQLFALWCQRISQHREHRLQERMAILHAERQFLRRSWSTWCQQAAAHHLEWQRQAVACAHHRLRWLRKAFCVWRESARGLRTERTGRARAARFHAAQLLCWAWSRWREVSALGITALAPLRLPESGEQCGPGAASSPPGHLQIYQSRVRSVLQEVAARESRHERRLLWGALRRWRENAVAQADEAKKASRAAAHYRRTLCSKVLIAWREAVSVQIYYRQQEGQAVRDAQVVLNRGCLRTWFRRWRDRSRSAAQQRVQMERVAQHYRRQLLLQAMARWKVHHLGCIRKRLLQRQAAQLLAQTLSRTCFHQWRQQLADRRREQQNTARALWFWAFSLQAKVWAAWLGFVLEMRRKKARQEWAVQAYHQQLLREGVTRLLCFAAGMKAFRQQLHARQQVQVGRGPPPLRGEQVSTARPDQRLVAGGPQSPPRGPSLWSPSSHIAAGAVARPSPLPPRFHLGQSLDSTGMTLGPEGLALTTPFLAKAQTALDPNSPLPSAPCLKLPPTASTGLELLPPSSFMLRVYLGPVSASSAQVTPGTWNPWVQPGPRREDGQDQAYSPIATGHMDLEAELEGIQQQLQDYQTTKQNLRSCQRQASSLRQWLELSQEEPRPDEQEAEQQVQEDLQEVEAQIQQLASKLQAQHQPIRTCIARVHALRQALC